MCASLHRLAVIEEKTRASLGVFCPQTSPRTHTLLSLHLHLRRTALHCTPRSGSHASRPSRDLSPAPHAGPHRTRRCATALSRLLIAHESTAWRTAGRPRATSSDRPDLVCSLRAAHSPRFPRQATSPGRRPVDPAEGGRTRSRRASESEQLCQLGRHPLPDQLVPPRQQRRESLLSLSILHSTEERTPPPSPSAAPPPRGRGAWRSDGTGCGLRPRSVPTGTPPCALAPFCWRRRGREPIRRDSDP